MNNIFKLMGIRNAVWVVAIFGWAASSPAQVSITSFAATYAENFNTLATSGSSSTLPTGWALFETGTNANTTYTANDGNGNTGDTYSYGTGTNTERAFGQLRSGSLVPLIGASFTNNTGSTIGGLIISYRGEEWRLGAVARVDTLNFQYSVNATSLSTGTWNEFNALDFVTPNILTTGAKNGNLAANSAFLNGTISGLNITSGSTFWIRWTDFDASGADDGLAVDSFKLKVCPTSITFTPPGTPPCMNGANITLNGSPAGGVYSGFGVVNGNQFDPSVGTQTITYKFPGCGLMQSAVITVNACVPLPEMHWQLLNDNAPVNGTCVGQSDCDLNKICFGLAFTPSVTGTLTSYTCQFLMNCIGGVPGVLTHNSCVMTTKDTIQDACASDDLIQFSTSGQNGGTPITAGVTIILHQVCFTIPSTGTYPVTLFAPLTASVDLPNGQGIDQFPGYSAFTLDSATWCGILPVRLLEFRAEKYSEHFESMLTWSTADEVNNSHFEIQRSNRTDGKFETIGRVNAVLHPGARNDYSFLDGEAKPGVNYYRFKQYDIDGKSTLSPIRNVTFNTSDFSIKVWPNPVAEELNVFVGHADVAGRYELFDLNGRKVAGRDFSDGDSLTTLDIEGLSAGVYSLVVQSGTVVHVEKIVVME